MGQVSAGNSRTRRALRLVWTVAAWCALGLCPLTGVGPPDARAEAFRNPFQSAAAIGQGNAFKAQADNASAIHYNPAAMTRLPGVQTTGVVSLISPRTQFTSTSGETTENQLPAGIGLPPPGAFFLTVNLRDRGIQALDHVALGIGLESLYGFAVKFPADGPLATSVTRAQVPLLDIKPTVAYEINDTISVGVGADIFTFASFLGEGQAERQFIGVGNIPGTSPGDTLELSGSGTTAGMNASLMLTPLRNAEGNALVAFGFVWRSQAVLPLDGQLLANGVKVADASTTIRFPESYEWGLAGWPIRDGDHEWKVEVDLDWVRWSSIRNFDTTLSNGVYISNPQFWKDGLSVFLGTEYKWLHLRNHPAWEVALRAGYTHAESVVPDINYDPAINDADANGVTAGIGFLCKPGGYFFWLISCGDREEGFPWRTEMGASLAYQAQFGKPRNVVGNPNPAVNGQYDILVQGVAIDLNVNF